MIRRSLLTAAAIVGLALSINSASARSPIQFGVKAGIQTQSLGNFKDLMNNGVSELKADNSFGYQLGIMSRFQMFGLFVQPELVYSHNRFNYKMTSQGNVAKVSVNDFEVPVLVGANIAFAKLFAGPVFNLMSDSKSGDLAVEPNFSKATAGFQIGAGVELLGINVDLRYQGQFKKPVQTLIVGNDIKTVKTSLNAWQLNLGYFF